MKKEDNNFKSLKKGDDLKQYIPVSIPAIRNDWSLLCKRYTKKPELQTPFVHFTYNSSALTDLKRFIMLNSL